jgi:hypothetical protein
MDSTEQLPTGPYFVTKKAAAYLGLSARTLEKHRVCGTGPVYRKIGGRIIYTKEDMDRWVARGFRTSTSDPGTDTIPPPRDGAPKEPPRE